MRCILLSCLAALCTGCARQATNDTHSYTSQPGMATHSTAKTPHYWSEAQKNRAEHYWLPQNLLPPDAPVGPGASPSNQNG